MNLVVSSACVRANSEIMHVYRMTGLPRNVRVLEDPRTAAQILRAIAKDLKKYKLEDLVRMVCISHYEI